MNRIWKTLAGVALLAAGWTAGAQEPGREGLGLTQAQKEQAALIRRETREKVEGILTAEQRAKLEIRREVRRALREEPGGERRDRKGGNPLRGLELTDAQKEQIRAIRKEGRERFLAILDPAQREQAERRRKERVEKRRERLQTRIEKMQKRLDGLR